MPFGDRTGPNGLGPMTGRSAGLIPYQVSPYPAGGNFQNSIPY
jgi:hypothetical protein